MKTVREQDPSLLSQIRLTLQIAAAGKSTLILYKTGWISGDFLVGFSLVRQYHK